MTRGRTDGVRMSAVWSVILKRREVKEMQNDDPKFSAEARQKLEEAGFLVYELTGVSIRELKDRGHHYIDLGGIYDEKEYPFSTVPSRRSQVALKPKNWVIREQNWSAVGQFSEELAKELGTRDIVAVVASAADYTEIIIRHLDQTGQNLLRGGASIDTTSFVGVFRYRLGSGFGWSDPVREYAYLTGDSFGRVVSVYRHCRCHPMHKGIAPIIVPRHSN